VRSKTRFEYLTLLDHVQQTLRPRTYVEIGVRFGTSLQLALPGTTCVGIDPAAELRYPVPRRAEVFNMKSDDFFATHDLREVLGGRPVDVAFIDGMHWFEYALRDFANIEAACSPGSVVFVHDCYPIDAASAARERTTKLWSGDVWKTILALRELRPDLHVVTLDAKPTGLAMITRLDPTSTVLLDTLDATIEHYMDMPYESMAGDQAEQLNRAPADWPSVAALLPPPFRATNGALLRAGRALRMPTAAQLRSRTARRGALTPT
jgi:predicted O-methyltransferase YrrM